MITTTGTENDKFETRKREGKMHQGEKLRACKSGEEGREEGREQKKAEKNEIHRFKFNQEEKKRRERGREKKSGSHENLNFELWSVLQTFVLFFFFYFFYFFTLQTSILMIVKVHLLRR